MQGLIEISIARSRKSLRNADTHTRIRTIRDAWLNILGIEYQFLIEYSIVATLQRFPISDSLVPVFALGSIFFTFDVIKGHLVWSDETTTGSHLYRQVAECQTAFHREVLDNITTIFYEIARSTTRSQLCH